ncbi:MAG: hypothetical protein ABIH86_07265 [Planctomycetota bacterium]
MSPIACRRGFAAFCLACLLSAPLLLVADAKIPDRIDKIYLKDADATVIEGVIVAESKLRILVVIKETTVEKVIEWSAIDRIERGMNTPMVRGVTTDVVDGEKIITGEGYRGEDGGDDILSYILELIPGFSSETISRPPDVRILPGNRQYIKDKLTGETKGEVSRPLSETAATEPVADQPKTAEAAFEELAALETTQALPATERDAIRRRFLFAYPLAANGDVAAIEEIRVIRETLGAPAPVSPAGPEPSLLPTGWTDVKDAPELAAPERDEDDEEPSEAEPKPRPNRQTPRKNPRRDLPADGNNE